MNPIAYTIILISSAYVSLIITFWPHEIAWQARTSLWMFMLYYCCPPLLLFLSFKGWVTSRAWRRMMAQRYLAQQSLSRVKNRRPLNPEKRSILEYACIAFAVLSLFALYELYTGANIWGYWL
ncbi:MAG: hypothetical protein ACRBDL_08855 [Alphaproteobacteria bacterium]